MAKRLSSFFSMTGAGLNPDQPSSQSRPVSTVNPDRPPREMSPARLQRRSTPNLRAAPLGVQYQAPFVPPLDTLHLSPQTYSADYNLLSPVGEEIAGTQDSVARKPVTVRRPDSRGPGRPISRGSGAEVRTSSRDGSASHSRAVSPAHHSRPQTPSNENRHSKRLSWFPGKHANTSSGASPVSPYTSAWTIAAQSQEKQHYDVIPLINFQKVNELWNDTGDTYIYLHSRESNRGPSFKVDSSLFAASRKLAHAAHGGPSAGTPNRSSQDSSHWPISERRNVTGITGRISPPLSQRGSSHKSSSTGGRSSHEFFDDRSTRQDIHLCLPSPLQTNLEDAGAKLSDNDVELLINLRNVFAFLLGLPLVATPKHPALFDVLLRIADILHRYEFSNLDGSTLGEEAYVAMERCSMEFKVADVRYSREKTIEAIILGERLKHWPLYNEGFVHAVGKYDDIKGLRSPKFPLISSSTQQRMERSTLDLSVRLRNVRQRLDDFYFPSLFAGFANSSTSSESKIVRFKAWKSSFSGMKRHVISFYKARYGAWPPKARSKKNDFEESGLNRILLQELYGDFSSLYDILVDRTSLTTRHMEIPSTDRDPEEGDEPGPRALRRIMSEYDRSVAPIQPPIPFDIPLLPTLGSTRRNFQSLEPRKQKKENMKRLHKDEINKALLQACNRNSLKSTDFLISFYNYERQTARGKSIEEIADLRIGQWIFMYAVLQALPLVVIDAPNVQFTQGVEYFLCEVPLGGAPWVQEPLQQKLAWYGVAGSSGLVSLPAHLVEYGVEGIYQRSHCWTAAEQWARTEQEGAEYEDFSAANGHNGHNTSDHVSPYDNDYYPSDQLSFERGHARTPSVPMSLRSPSPASGPGSRTHSPNKAVRRPSSALNLMSLGLGLEQLPLPQSVTVGPAGTTMIGPAGGGGGGSNNSSRPTSQHDPTKSFDAILAANGEIGGKSKKK